MPKSPNRSAHFSADDFALLPQTGFSQLLKDVLEKEREFYLASHDADRANGHAPARTFWIAHTPVEVRRPLTRGQFYPALLPKHQRYLPHPLQQLLKNTLLRSKNVSAARRALQTLGTGYSIRQVEELLLVLRQGAELFFRRPLASNWLCLLADAEIIELQRGQSPARRVIHFLVIGKDLEGRKEILSATAFRGDSVEKGWRKVFGELKNRGMAGFAHLVTTDSGNPPPLASPVREFFPDFDCQTLPCSFVATGLGNSTPATSAVFDGVPSQPGDQAAVRNLAYAI